VAAFASITLKQDEPGLRALSERWQLPVHFYTPEELGNLPGVFTASSFVHSVTGVDNVCERSAVLCAEGGHLMALKTPIGPVTVAVARRECFFEFTEEG
jgi:cobalt-precorrin 5A hydrolase